MSELSTVTLGLERTPGPVCPSCAEWGVRTPVEKWGKVLMRYCTFHYWMMSRRRAPHGFSLDVYVEHSRSFGFVPSLPPPRLMAAMSRKCGAQIVTSTEFTREPVIRAVRGQTTSFVPKFFGITSIFVARTIILR